MRACVIFNPTAKGDRARHFRKHLDEIGADAALKQTTHAGAARELAQAAVEAGFDTIVAAGGDGTLNEVVNGIGDAPNGYARARFALLPLGTVNVFALELGIPFELRAAWQIVMSGKERLIDLPEAEFQIRQKVGPAVLSGPPKAQDLDPQFTTKTVRRKFLQMAGAGWDARVVELVNWELKKRIGRFAYVWAGFGALSPRKIKPRVHVNGSSTYGDFILIGNGKLYAGKFPFLHTADLADGLLDVTVFPEFNWKSMPACMTNFVLGKYFKPGAQPYFTAPSLELSSDDLTPLQLDGELVGHLPAKITLLPKTLRVLAP